MASSTATSDPSPSRATRVSARTLSLTLGGVAALVSSVLRPSWDETFWLGVARLVDGGRGLYDGAIDNKTPPVYLLTWLIDRAPGEFPAARAVVIGALITAISLAALRLVRTDRHRTLIVVVVTLTLMFATDFVLTTELCAATAILWGLVAARRSAVIRTVASGVLSAAFDPRAVLLFVALAFATRDSAARRRIGLGLGAVTAVAAATVLLFPDLRYGLIEANVASRGLRGGLDLVEWAIAFAQTALPIVLLMVVVRRTPSPTPCVAVAIGALVIGASSIHGFPHYWTYLSIVPLLSAPADGHATRAPTALAVFLIGAALIPSLAETVTIADAQQDLWSTYRPVVDAIGPDDRIIVWDIRPHVATARADANLLRSPTIHYLGWRTSRTESFLAELPALIDSATLIVDSGGLTGDPEGVVPELRPARDIISSRLGDFPCASNVGRIVIRSREGCTP